MNNSKLRNLFVIIATVFLVAIPLQSKAAEKGNHNAAQQDEKERLVLMPLRVPEEDKNLLGAMETALVEGLQQKYDVFSGEQVSQKAHQIFLKESRNTAHTECDETRCMQNIAEAFQAELIATANVTKQDSTYFLALSIQNIFDNKVVYSKSSPCEGCSKAHVVNKLKELSGVAVISKTDNVPDSSQNDPDPKQNAAQRKIEQKALVERSRNNIDKSRLESTNSEFSKPSPIAQPNDAKQYLHYLFSSDGAEVTDQKTQLIWRRCAEGMEYSGDTCVGIAGTFDYNGALQRATDQANKTGLGWRVPDKDELASIVDKSLPNSSIDPTSFPATPNNWFWTSSRHVANRTAWIVSFNNNYTGSSTTSVRNGICNVRLVRTVQ